MDLNISKTTVPIESVIQKVRKKSRPIIVKFVRYCNRRDVFMNKKCLKGKGKSITENLTGFRLKEVRKCKRWTYFLNVWIVDGKIMFRNSDNGKPNVYYG